jgi:hypothetical protein
MAVNPFTMQPTDNPFFQPANLLQMAGGMLQAPNFAQGAGNSLATLGQNVEVAQEKQKTKQQENATRAALQKLYPDQDLSSLQGPDLHALLVETQKRKMFPAAAEFKTLADGTYGTWDGKSFNRLGKAENPNDMPAAYRDWQLQQKDPAYRAHAERNSRTGQTFEERKRMAEEMGLTEADPEYRPFVLTGKMPREDQQTLTAIDKKAIQEGDEMVAVNAAAIDALKQAKTVSKDANSGWLSGTRATVGANLPDWMVSDYISSPESSNATIDFDNAIVGQALGQLKAIFGGAPTEGERKILLDLQGSSNLPVAAREKIIDRAIAAAERRLEFNKQRVDELRGNTYYKPRDGQTALPASTAGKTKTGITFSVDGP